MAVGLSAAAISFPFLLFAVTYKPAVYNLKKILVLIPPPFRTSSVVSCLSFAGSVTPFKVTCAVDVRKLENKKVRRRKILVFSC